MKKLLFLATFIVLLTNMYAFDGVRKGFIFGAGLGVNQESNLAINLKLGYSPMNNFNIYSFVSGSYSSIGDRDDVGLGFVGLGVTQFLNRSQEWQPSFFVSSGFGRTLIDNDDKDDKYTGKNAYFIGLGYEFLKFFNVEASIMKNNVQKAKNSSIKHDNTVFSITLNLIAYDFYLPDLLFFLH